MKIKDKIYIGIFFYILSGIIVGFLMFWQFKLISEKLNIVAKVNAISNMMLEIRRYEKNYLLYNDQVDVEEFFKHIQGLKSEINNIKSEFEKIGLQHYEDLKKSIEAYEKNFHQVVVNNQNQDEMMKVLFNYSISISRNLSITNSLKAVEMKTRERNFFLNKDEKSFKSLSECISNNVNNIKDLDKYKKALIKMYELFKEQRSLVDSLRLQARNIQDFTFNFTKHEKKDVENMLKRALMILMIAYFTALITGLVVSIRFTVTVIRPLLALEETTRKIADGDFSHKIDIKGNDEIASLQKSFNVMVEKLHNSMLSLETAYKQLKEKQKQLVGAEKLASVGILASGIAHEISNPLTSVLTFATLMLEKTPDTDPNKEKLSIMVRETVRAREIVRQLLTFAKETPVNLQKANVNIPVTEAIKTLMEQELFKDIEVITNLDENLPEIMIDSDRITQVMLNMLLNATHAIIRPGKIEVTTRRDNDMVDIIISDTGVGIPEKHLSRIFDPFFSTKEQTKGTGLGLAVSYGLIKKHGGTINVTSEVGKGTTFTVRLPINGKD